MNFSISDEDDGRVLSLSGRFVLHAQKEAEGALDTLCAIKAERYVIDFAEVDSIDSTGLGLLLVAAELAARKDKQIVLRGLTGLVAHALNLAKITDKFIIE